MARDFRFCPGCASRFERQLIHGIDRLICPGCEFVFWQNPVVGVAVVVVEANRIVLGRRSRGVYAGAWCIPCGYVEYDEDVRAAARREFREETGLGVEIGDVCAVHSNFHNPEMHSVGIWFSGSVVEGTLRAADDLDEVAYVELEVLPTNLAFPTDRLVLEQLRQELGISRGQIP